MVARRLEGLASGVWGQAPFSRPPQDARKVLTIPLDRPHSRRGQCRIRDDPIVILRPSMEVRYQSSQRVDQIIASLGRTEDVSFSPSSLRLAVAAFTRNRIAVFDVEISTSPAAPHIALTAAAELSSPALSLPHGVDFIDEDTLISRTVKAAWQYSSCRPAMSERNGKSSRSRLGQRAGQQFCNRQGQ